MPSSFAEYAAAIAYVLMRMWSFFFVKAGRERKSSQNFSNEPS